MTPATTPAPHPADVLLADGSVAVIRPLRAGDRPGLLALHDRVSDDSIRLRFFANNRHTGHEYVDHLFSTPGPAACLVTTVRDRIVAVATAEPNDAESAEVAFLVDDSLQGRGAGSLLLEHLAATCRDLGIRRFTAEVLLDNRAMSAVFRDAGFETTHRASDGVVDVEMSTAASARAVAAADERERSSEGRSLAALARPGRVAVVGARRDGTGIGRAVLESIVAGGFTGDLVAIHPRAEAIGGVTAWRRLADVPGQVDLAVVAVPATAALDVARDAAEAGVGALVVISSGFEELGAEGAGIQRDLLRLARDHSMRLVGPNCLGVMVNDPDLRLNATFTRMVPPYGGLAVASQSGGVGIALLDVATRMGLGVASFVSLGNKADVSGNDLLAAWLEDPRVTAAALYLESFGNVAKFARVARTFSEHKPLLAVVGGRSAGGRRAGASHTAAAATPAVGVNALFEHAGVIACHSAESLAETALLLAEQPRPEGPRVAVISNAGGMGVLAADAADARGLVVPELSPALRGRIAPHVSGTTGTSNPVDLGAGAGDAALAATTAEVLASGEVDALVVVLVATSVNDPRPLLVALAEARRHHPERPVVLVPLGGLTPDPGSLDGVTVLPSIDAAVDALERVVRYAAWLRVPHEEPEPPDEARAVAARRVAVALLEEPQGQRWLAPREAALLLGPYGLAAEGTVADDLAGALRAADALGFPVAVKVADPRIVHKTERGLVRSGLRDPAEVTAAVRAFRAELGHSRVPVLVQPMVSGVEVALGLVRDAAFGPLVMVAAGGISTDLWDDRVFLLPPVTPRDAARAVRSLRLWPLLDGFRATVPVDVAALERHLVSVGQLALDVPAVAELDLNPVLMTPDGPRLVDVKVRLEPGTLLDAGIPRRLRAAR